MFKCLVVCPQTGNRAQHVSFLLATESKGTGVSLVMWLSEKLGICCGGNGRFGKEEGDDLT